MLHDIDLTAIGPASPILGQHPDRRPRPFHTVELGSHLHIAVLERKRIHGIDPPAGIRGLGFLLIHLSRIIALPSPQSHHGSSVLLAELNERLVFRLIPAPIGRRRPVYIGNAAPVSGIERRAGKIVGKNELPIVVGRPRLLGQGHAATQRKHP